MGYPVARPPMNTILYRQTVKEKNSSNMRKQMGITQAIHHAQFVKQYPQFIELKAFLKSSFNTA